MKTASDLARELNAKTHEWLAANPNAWATTLPEEPEFWAERGIHTAEELDRDMAINAHSDAYKEAVGFRPRSNWDGVATADIWAEYHELCEEARKQWEREEAMEANRGVEAKVDGPSFDWMDETATVNEDGTRSWTL